jgi:glycosyltransferase involved in cell wall biosynthesis
MNNKILTVSIAAYNVENYIEEALEPFVNEEIIDDLEIFIIDDGAEDATVEIAKKFTDIYPQSFKIIQKNNGGWGSTVNYGIQHATGKYFKQLDGDDYFNKDTLVEFVNILKKYDADLILTQYVEFENGHKENKKNKGIVNNYELWKIYDIRKMSEIFDLNMHSCTFKTSILKDNIKLLEHCFYTDIEYVLKALIHVETIVFTDIEVYQYRVAREGQSMSIEGLRKHYKEHENVIFTMLNYYNNQNNMVDFIDRMFRKRLLDMIDTQYMIFLYLVPNYTHKFELIKFDKAIKEKYNKFYQKSTKRVNFLRRVKFCGYAIVSTNSIKKLEYM